MATLDQVAGVGTRRDHSLRALGLCLIAAVLSLGVPTFEHAYLYMLVTLLLACVMVPVWYGWSRGRLDYFEPIHVFGFVYFVFFGLGAVWTVQNPKEVAYDLYIVPYIPLAVLYCLLGYLTLLLGYYGPWCALATRLGEERPRGVTFLVFIGGMGISGFLAVRIAERAAALGFALPTMVGSLSQLAPLFLFVWALAWLLYFSDTATKAQKMTLFLFLVPGALISAYSTFSDKSLIMTIVGVPIIARWYTRRRVPWTTLLVLLLVLVFVIFPFYNTYRWSDPNLGEVTRFKATYERIQQWDSRTFLRFSLETFKGRLAMINSVAVVVRDVGRWEPHARGKTIFMPILTFFIPRVLWPDKPQTTLGKDFGRLFRVTDFRNPDVFIGVTVPGELYWNYHLPGILVGMGLLGMGMRFLYRRYGESTRLDPVRRAMHILLLINIAHFGGGAIAPALVALIRTVIVLEVLRLSGRHFGLIEVVDGQEPAPPTESRGVAIPAPAR